MRVLIFLLWVISPFILGGLSGLLAALTGAGFSKIYRRVIVPAISTLYGLIMLWNLWYITLMVRSAVLSQGYGVPDATDKGSVLGRFWFKIFNGSTKWASIFTRGTLGLQEGICLSAIPILTGHWILWGITTLAITWNWIYWGYIKKNEGTFILFGKELLWEEVELHGINSFLIFLLILICRIIG